MPVQIVSEPDLICPNPVENKFCVCFQPDDAVSQIGTKAAALLAADTGFVSNVNGEKIFILGQEFTVSDATPFSYNTFDGTDPVLFQTNAFNLYSAIKQNHFFKDYDVYFISGATFFVIVIENCETGPIEDATIDDSGLTASASLGTVVFQGVSLTLVDGYDILYQLYCDNGTKYVSVCPEQAVSALSDPDGLELEICVDFSYELSRLVRTTIPTLSQSVIYDDTIKKTVVVKYGNKVDAVDCGVDYKDFFTSPEYEIVNAAFQNDDELKFDPYCFDSILETIKFMSARPRISTICSDSYQWLWACLNLNDFFEPFTPIVRYYLVREEFLNGVSLGETTTQIGTTDGVIVVPVGTANMEGGFTNAPIDKYTVRLTAEVENVIPGILDVDITETVTYVLANNCCCDAEFYFLSEPGGYDTICMDEMLSKDLLVEQTEICTEIDCGGTYQQGLINEGKRQINTNAREQMTFVTRGYQRSEEALNFFTQFKKSESRFVKITDKQGNTQIRQFLVVPGGIQIFSKDQKLQLAVTGYFGSDLKQQSEY